MRIEEYAQRTEYFGGGWCLVKKFIPPLTTRHSGCAVIDEATPLHSPSGYKIKEGVYK